MPLLLSAHGTATFLLRGESAWQLALVATAGVLGLAGLAGWRGTGAILTRALALAAIAFTISLADSQAVTHMLQWWYSIAAVYSLILPMRVALGGAVVLGASMYALYPLGAVTLSVGGLTWLLRSILLTCLAVIVALAGDAYRRARDDATQRGAAAERAELRLYHATTHDTLTGLPNRSSLDRYLDLALARRPAGADHQVAVLLIDLDRFRNVNETLGHRVGDRLLREVGDRIAGALPAGQWLARLGGDEFAVVCAPTTPARAEATANQVVALFTEPVELNGSPYRIGLSVGVAVSGDGIEACSDLLRSADAAMYAAKAAGRGRAVSFDSRMSEDVAANLAVEQQLRAAIALGAQSGCPVQGAITAVFQPVVDLCSSRVVAAEALARWELDGRQVSPLRFVPLAEELGLGCELAMVIARQSMAALASWHREGLTDVVSVAVNIGARDLLVPSLADDLADAVMGAGLRPGALTLEITEREVVDDVEQARAAMQRLRAQGITVAVDDFGTGFSSLAYLARLPLQVLKIDREFVANLDVDDTIARTVVQLARSFGMQCIAEGVETQEQLDALCHLGVQAGQGWHLGRPSAADRFVRAVRAQRTIA